MPYPVPLTSPRRLRMTGFPFGQPLPLAGQLCWYAADSEAYANNDAVGTFTDRSGNGRDATQATAANKPTFKTNILNGLPGVLFDGTNDRLAVPTTVALTNAGTIILVTNVVALPASGHLGFIFKLEVTDGSESVYLCTVASGWIAFQALDVGAYQFTLDQHIVAGHSTILIGRFQSNDVTLFAGGGLTDYSTSNALNISATNYVRLGCEADSGTEDEFFSGYIFEFSVFNRVLSLGEVDAWANYLKVKYNFPAS